MCGIVGWVSTSGRVDQPTLVAMRDAMVHRGPDGHGIWLSTDGMVGLAHRRLSIIDLSVTANQPMVDVNEQAVIVFNGEIYNHRALRQDLEETGARFGTDHSDTECLLVGYLTWGMEELLRRLIGMFAFAVYDIRARQLHLVRDRVGIKPLYVAETSDGLLFASEAKALLKHPAITPALDNEAFYHYLSFRAVPGPRTLFRGIKTLLASETVTFDVATRKIQSRIWWDPFTNAQSPPGSLEQACDRLEELVGSSVEARLESDVPVGLFLSGGLDSGYLLKLMSPSIPDLSTYTVSYPGFAEYNEGHLASALAKETHARYYDVPLSSEDFLNALPAVAYYQDEPIAAPVCTSVFFLSRMASQTGRKVVLAGEGSDEVFIGYQSWIALRRLIDWNQRLPDLPYHLLRRLAYWFASHSLPWMSPYCEILRRAAAPVPLFWGGSMDFTEDAKKRLLGDAISVDGRDTYEEIIAPLRRQFLKHAPASDTTAWMTYIDLRFRLPQLMLPRLDRMGMAFSIEGRVPYLDHRIIEFVLSLRREWRGGTGKIGKPLLKAVAERQLPRSFVHRPKQGFRAPVREWRESAFGERYIPLLFEFARRTRLLNVHALEQLVGRGGRLYFSLTNFMLWYLLFVENVLSDRIDDELLSPERFASNSQ